MSRILMLTHEFDPLPAGIARYARELALAAHQLGHQVTVLAPDYGRSDLSQTDRQYPYCVRRFSGGIYHLANLLPLLFRTLRSIGREKWDVIHAVDWPFALALRTVGRYRELSFVATIYGTELLSLRQSRQVAWMGASDMFRRAERCFAISEFTRQLLLDTIADIDVGRIIVTPLGVSPFWFLDVSDDEQRIMRLRLGVSPSNRIVLTVARLDPRKGQDRVISALNRLPLELKANLTYVVVGSATDKGYAAELDRLAAQSAVPVVFTGVITDTELRALYADAHVFCLPGEPHPMKVEGFGLAYLEAAAQGCPSVGCRVAAVPEIVRSGETGLLVAPKDINELSGAIRRVLDDSPLRTTLGNAAKLFAAQFTWERCAQLTYGSIPASQNSDCQLGQH